MFNTVHFFNSSDETNGGNPSQTGRGEVDDVGQDEVEDGQANDPGQRLVLEGQFHQHIFYAWSVFVPLNVITMGSGMDHSNHITDGFYFVLYSKWDY